MNATRTIEINSANPTRLAPGVYRATGDTIVTLFHGVGDSRRQVEYRTAKAGEQFGVVQGVNGHWTGAELATMDDAQGELEFIG